MKVTMVWKVVATIRSGKQEPNKIPFCLQLTTALRSGGWVPGMSKGFHFWQPAPRLNNAPMAGTTLQPSHEPPRQAEGTSKLRIKARRQKGLMTGGRRSP